MQAEQAEPEQEPTSNQDETPAEAQETPPREPPAEESKPEETESGGEESEATEDAEEKPALDAKAEDKHKRVGGFQRKIERLERQNQILMEQLQANRPQQPQPSQPAKEKTPADQAAEYITSLVRQEAAALRAQEKEAAQQAEFQKRVAEARATRADFDEVIADASHIQLPRDLQRALLTSERPGEIMYQLAKNPAELARLSALPPLDAAREIGRLEAKASGAVPQKPRSASRPPAPPSSVKGSASSTRSLDDLPISEYKRAIRSGRR